MYNFLSLEINKKEMLMTDSIYKIGVRNLAITNKMKCLGTYTTSKKNRRRTVNERTKAAHRGKILLQPMLTRKSTKQYSRDVSQNC